MSQREKAESSEVTDESVARPNAEGQDGQTARRDLSPAPGPGNGEMTGLGTETLLDMAVLFAL